MKNIIKNRTIRPSTRLKTSKSYKINTTKVNPGDLLTVNINHENNLFRRSFRFDGNDIGDRDSIHFRVNDEAGNIHIIWTSVQPV